MRKEQMIYLEKLSPQNTEDVIDAVKTYVARSGLKRVVAASTTGATAVKFAAALENTAELVVATHYTGFSQESKQRFDAEEQKILERQSVIVLTQSHVLSEIERSIALKSAAFHAFHRRSSSLPTWTRTQSVCGDGDHGS